MTRIILSSAPIKVTKLQRTAIKKTRSKKATILRKALSSKESTKESNKHDPGDLNQYSTELASTLKNTENIAFDQSLLANILSELEKRPELCYTTQDVY